MRRIRDVLRLRFGERLSLHDVSASLQTPFTTVSDHVRRATAIGLSWPLPAGLDDRDLDAMLFSSAARPTSARPLPD